MKKEWFKDYIKSWTSEISWKGQEIDKIAELLVEIAKNNGGEIIEDVQVTEEEKKQLAVKRADEALQQKVNAFARYQKRDKTFRYYGKETGEKSDSGLNFIVPHKLVPRVELNSCSLEELAALPGIGEVTGKRIIDRRQTEGPFTDIKEVAEIDGITKEDFYKFKNMLYIEPKGASQVFSFPEMGNFLEKPDFCGYLELLLKTKGFIGIQTNLSIKEQIIAELEDLKNTIIQNPFYIYKNLKQTRSSNIATQAELRKKFDEIERKSVSTVGDSGLIFDADYVQVVTELIKRCKRSLNIIMFFFKFEDEGKYPTDEVVDEIIKAKNRGIDVKVILDLDRKKDPYKSKDINEGVYQYFKDKGINVVLDAPEKLTHTKMFIVDGRHVVIGSHNLTAGSIYAYDDTSVYINSEDYAKQRLEQFKSLWEEYSLIEQYQSVVLNKIINENAAVETLDRLRITNSIGFLLNAKTTALRKELAKKINWDEKVVLKTANICDLLRLKDMPVEYAVMLEKAGVDTIPEIAQRTPENLQKELKKYQSEQHEMSTLPEIEELSKWIEQAKTMERILEY